jgi:alpha-galactosidase
MQIGVWFEFETVPLRVRELIGADDCFLFRNGEMVAPNRPLANFRSKKLVDYLNRQVDALYAMGVRFIKNDHNNAEYLGSTLYGECAAEGLEKNEQAFLAFIDGIRKRYPDLILENFWYKYTEIFGVLYLTKIIQNLTRKLTKIIFQFFFMQRI